MFQRWNKSKGIALEEIGVILVPGQRCVLKLVYLRLLGTNMFLLFGLLFEGICGAVVPVIFDPMQLAYVN